MSKIKIQLATALAESFGRTLSEPALKLYVSALGGISDEAATNAAKICMQKCKFFPAASELIELATTGGVTYEAQALLAFEQLEVALNQNKPSLMPPLVAAVVRQLGGFDVLAAMPLPEFSTWKRKEFIAAYATLAKENPDRVAAIAGPRSEIAEALFTPKRISSREDDRAIEDKNRKSLMDLSKTPYFIAEKH